MRVKFAVAFVALSLLAGCASVPMADNTASNQAKQFSPPGEGKAGLYVFRDGILGSALKRAVYVDGKCLGESAPRVFFHTEVDGDKTHILSTQSEFSPNQLSLYMKAGINYFVRQYIKMGVLVGGANLESVSDEEGKKAISQLSMAANTPCDPKPDEQAAKK
ncbi:MAG: DUF2846 domain-containing protein [Bordetella sp.]|uniref:DUF2846 domain-containing protein n=1 Tax=Bordetella sp. TaxID=28081 RepID=UPI003F7BBB1A